MKKTITTLLAAAAVLSASAINGLTVVGDGTLTGWTIETPTTIPVDTDDASVYTATLYLEANQDFKFLTTNDWGGDEYGAALGATLDANGTISLAMGKNDEGYDKIQVPEDGNYVITVNTEAMTATFVKAAYQETQIRYAALFMIGSATSGEWDLAKATVLYQDPEKPYEYATPFQTFKEGSFKIAISLKGGGSFKNEFYYYKDVDNADKMVLGQAGDEQWTIDGGTHKVVANTIDNTLNIVTKIVGLTIVGDATPYGYSIDDATTMPVDPENENLYCGTLYLKANADFKFLTTLEWGNNEYGAAPGATIAADGKVDLAMGKGDQGYDELSVAEDGNYFITVNTATKTATIVKSVYQTTPINYCALYIVGTATPGQWSMVDATVMYQKPEKPYQYATLFMPFNDGSFKIATAIKGGSSFQNKYYYFKDVNDEGKMALGQSGDEQWNVNAGSYVITANTVDNTLVIKDNPTSLTKPAVSQEGPVTYYNLQGMPVANPANGLYLVRTADGVKKVYIR